MDYSDATIAVFPEHTAAEAAIKKLTAAGFDMKKLSVVGKGYHTEEKVVGFYNVGDRVTFWGTRGAFWGGLWALFFGGLFVTTPLIGPVIALGLSRHNSHRRHRGRSGCWRSQRLGRRALQHRHPQGQRCPLRGRHQDRRLPGDGAWHCGRSGTRQGHSRHSICIACRHHGNAGAGRYRRLISSLRAGRRPVSAGALRWIKSFVAARVVCLLTRRPNYPSERMRYRHEFGPGYRFTSQRQPLAFWTQPVEAFTRELNCTLEGLTTADAARRAREWGTNADAPTIPSDLAPSHLQTASRASFTDPADALALFRQQQVI